jgi:rhodanese-related sulfurtransferase
VKANYDQSGIPSRLHAAQRFFLEAALVAALGAAFAFAANQVSPLGLSLTRDYFPTGTGRLIRPAANDGLPVATGTNSGAVSPAQFLDEQMKKRGLQLVNDREAAQLFHDSRLQEKGIIFIDARDGEHYRQCHIPGAYEFDPYHPEKYFGTVLPVCQKAEQIVVYCNGGDCDDSESAAILLREVGIPNQKLMVYGGGITAWTTNGLPVEIGARNSGNLHNLTK